MSEKINLNPEQYETHSNKIIEIWVVDDSKDIAKSLLQGWESIGEGFDFAYFTTAQDALKNIEEKILHKQDLPQVIFVDGNLLLDQGELKNGENFIYQIRKLDINQPKIIAHSTSRNSNEAMLGAGADFAINKGSVLLKDYLAYFESLKQKQEK